MPAPTIGHLIDELRGSDGQVAELRLYADDPGVLVAKAVKSLPVDGKIYAWIVQSMALPGASSMLTLRARDEDKAREALQFLGDAYIGALRVIP